MLSKNNYFSQFIDLIEGSKQIRFSQDIRDIVASRQTDKTVTKVEDEQASTVVESVGTGISSVVKSVTLFPIAFIGGGILFVAMIAYMMSGRRGGGGKEQVVVVPMYQEEFNLEQEITPL